ncbi:MAG TPA: hypothetical protein VG317_01990 [Pseudonocardiaceae bacterium]|nr:hypothetical protein [Pseudonocardiaceae bacterium]
MSAARLAGADELRGQLLFAGAPHPVSAGALVSGPVSVAGRAGARGEVVRVHPAIAMLLREPLTAEAGPGELARSVAAAFVAGHLAHPGEEADRFVLGDRPVPVPLRGPITVWSGTDLPDTYLPEDFGDLAGRLVRLAGLAGELSAGQLAVLGPLTPRAGIAARPGTVQLWGPGDTALIVHLVRAGHRNGGQRP